MSLGLERHLVLNRQGGPFGVQPRQRPRRRPHQPADGRLHRANGPLSRALGRAHSICQASSSAALLPDQPPSLLLQAATASATVASAGSNRSEGPWKAKSASTALREPTPCTKARWTMLRTSRAVVVANPFTAAPHMEAATIRPPAY